MLRIYYLILKCKKIQNEKSVEVEANYKKMVKYLHFTVEEKKKFLIFKSKGKKILFEKQDTLSGLEDIDKKIIIEKLSPKIHNSTSRGKNHLYKVIEKLFNTHYRDDKEAFEFYR